MALPTDPAKVKQLELFLGSKGFGMTGDAYYTWRHSAVQLERVLENKSILRNADEIVFESRIQGTMGVSYTDIRIVRPDKTVIEIETKAGMSFFNNLDDANSFITQSSNSLEAVSRLEDYKVFLNPQMVNQLSTNPQALNQAKTKVINAWRNGGVLDNGATHMRFSEYFEYFDEMDGDILKGLLENNNNWFEEIFINSLL